MKPKKMPTVQRTTVYKVGSHLSSMGRSVVFYEVDGNGNGHYSPPVELPAGGASDGAIIRVTTHVELVQKGKRIWNPANKKWED